MLDSPQQQSPPEETLAVHYTLVARQRVYIYKYLPRIKTATFLKGKPYLKSLSCSTNVIGHRFRNFDKESFKLTRTKTGMRGRKEKENLIEKAEK